jgi:hypothetical protein
MLKRQEKARDFVSKSLQVPVTGARRNRSRRIQVLQVTCGQKIQEQKYPGSGDRRPEGTGAEVSRFH